MNVNDRVRQANPLSYTDTLEGRTPAQIVEAVLSGEAAPGPSGLHRRPSHL